MRRSGLVVVLTTAGLAVAGAAAAGSAAAAAGCAARITVSHPSGSRLVLSPSVVKVPVGGCVQFTNSTAAKVTITVSGKPSYDAAVAAGATTTPATSYHPRSVGAETVTATQTVLIAVKTTGSSRVHVTPAAKSSPSSSPPAPGKHGRSPAPGKKPAVAPKPHKHHGRHGKNHSPKPHATGINLPPLPPLPSAGVTTLSKGTNPLVASAPPNVASSPTSTSPSPVAAIVSGPLEPPTDDTRGLPEAIAVLVALGALSGWGRVLLAQAGGAPRPRRRAGAGRHRT